MPNQSCATPPSDWPHLGPGEMSPRERVCTALSHREPDRVPCDLWAYFGAASRAEVLRLLRVDVRWVVPDYVGPQRSLPGGIIVGPYGSWRKRQRHEFGEYKEYAG